MDETEAPTPEEIGKVLRWQCEQRGAHEWRAVMEVGDLIPVAFTCSNCDVSCTVRDVS